MAGPSSPGSRTLHPLGLRRSRKESSRRKWVQHPQSTEKSAAGCAAVTCTRFALQKDPHDMACLLLKTKDARPAFAQYAYSIWTRCSQRFFGLSRCEARESTQASAI